MNEGYIKIPRSLLNDPVWKSLPYTYRHVYLTILEHMVFKETTFDDFGILVTLKPGQFLTTIRRLAELCDEPDIDKSLIERALAKFEKVGFSRQTSRHRKTIITITRKDICELIETKIETNSRQTRDIKEESEESAIAFSQEKEASKKKIVPIANRAPPFQRKKWKRDDLDALVNYCLSNQISIAESDFRKWLDRWDATYIVSHLMLMMKRGANEPAKWMQTALKQDYVGEDSRISNNRLFAQKIKFESRWMDLVITEKYCRDELTQKDFMFDAKEEVFQQWLLNEIKQKQGII